MRPLEDIIPNALKELRKVLEEHGAQKYSSNLVEENVSKTSPVFRRLKALGHIVYGMKGRTEDPDSGVHPHMHAVAQLLLAREQELIKLKNKAKNILPHFIDEW